MVFTLVGVSTFSWGSIRTGCCHIMRETLTSPPTVTIVVAPEPPPPSRSEEVLPPRTAGATAVATPCGGAAGACRARISPPPAPPDRGPAAAASLLSEGATRLSRGRAAAEGHGQDRHQNRHQEGCGIFAEELHHDVSFDEMVVEWKIVLHVRAAGSGSGLTVCHCDASVARTGSYLHDGPLGTSEIPVRRSTPDDLLSP